MIRTCPHRENLTIVQCLFLCESKISKEKDHEKQKVPTFMYPLYIGLDNKNERYVPQELGLETHRYHSKKASGGITIR